MSSCDYIGDTGNISPRQLEFVSDVLKNLGYAGKQVTVSPLGKTGDNYGSYVRKFTVEYESGKTFRMIGKIAPTGQFLGNQSPTSDFFTNETLLYNGILPKFGQMQKSAGVPEEDRLRYPICYGALSEQKNEIILLEDLGEKNYVMLDKKQPLTDRIIKLVLQNIANFHSMSYVLKIKDSQVYEKLMGGFANALMNQEVLLNAQKIFQAALSDMKLDDDRYINVIKDIMQNFIKSSTKIFSSDRGSKYSLVQHGDLWTNNIMFQMQDDQPEECLLIDYQLSRECSPAYDIHSLIFNCTDYKTRSKHYYECIDYYHSELDRYLNYYGLKVNYVYPRDTFDADLKRYGKPCLGVALMMISFLLRESQEAVDIAVFENMNSTRITEDLGIKNLTAHTLGVIKERIEGLVKSCFEYGYLTDEPKATFE